MSTHDYESDAQLQNYFDEYGRSLHAVADADVPAARRAPRRLIALGASGLAVAAIVAWLLSGAAPGNRLDVVSEARAALAPAGEIVHMVVTTSLLDAAGTRSSTVEQWSAADPPRWRLVQTLPPAGARLGVMYDSEGNVVEGRQEFAYADGEQRAYFAERDVLEINQGFSGDGPAAAFPSILGEGAEDLRGALDSGRVRDEGELVLDGRTVRRLVSERGDGMALRRWTYDVDPKTFAPIQAELEFGVPFAGAERIRAHLVVDKFERIPLNDETEQLLTIATTPNTKVTVRTAEDMRERERRAREGCKPMPNGDESCPGIVAPPDPPSKQP
jgi:YD repeat-containing protein